MTSPSPTSYVPADATEDALNIQVACHNVLAIPAADWATHPINLSLQEAGITGFLLLSSLQDHDLQDLGYTHGTHGFVKLNVSHRGLLRALIAYYQEASRRTGAALDPSTLRKRTFNRFRSSTYNPNTPIQPWHVHVESRTVTDLKKSIKKNSNDCPKFSDDKYFVKWRDAMELFAQAHFMKDLLDSKAVILDHEADRLNRDWLYQAMYNAIKAPKAKKIILEHKDDHDTRAIWSKILAEYKNCTSQEVYLNQLSTHLNLANFADKSQFSGTFQARVQDPS